MRTPDDCAGTYAADLATGLPRTRALRHERNSLRAAPGVSVMLPSAYSCASPKAPRTALSRESPRLGEAEAKVRLRGEYPHLEGIQAERQASAAGSICRPVGKRSHRPDLGDR
jgi:hypothetical protein